MPNNDHAERKDGTVIHIAKSSSGDQLSGLQGDIYKSVKEWIDFINSDDCVKIYCELYDNHSKEKFIATWFINDKGTSAYNKDWLRDNNYVVLPTPDYVSDNLNERRSQHWLDGKFLFTGAELF